MVAWFHDGKIASGYLAGSVGVIAMVAAPAMTFQPRTCTLAGPASVAG